MIRPVTATRGCIGVSEFELYCFAESGNAYKAALMLNLCAADWRPRFVDYLGGETYARVPQRHQSDG